MEWLPFVNLLVQIFQQAPPTTSGGIIYDVLQVLATLTIMSRLGARLATLTKSHTDDNFWARLIYWFGRGTTLVTDLSSGNLKHK